MESVFRIIKKQQRARRFLLRSLDNVATEWTVLATAFNLQTLWKTWCSRSYTVPMPDDSRVPGKATDKVALPDAVLCTVHDGGPG